MTGTASNGVDYTNLSGVVTFAPNATSTNVFFSLINDSLSEATETATLILVSGTNYGLITPSSATISILDDDIPEVSISVVQSNLLEAFSGATATFQLSRKGLLASNLTVNLTYGGGTATPGVDFTGPATRAFPANAATTNFTISPINDNLYEGTETATANVAAGTGYNVGSPASAAAFIIDDDLPATTVLFSEKFDSASSSNNWVINREDGGADSFADFGYNYSVDGIPEAPSSVGSFAATRGLKFRVNENFGTLNGLSASPLNGNFTGDYRLRFDMWLNYVGPLPTGGTGSTEHLSAGVGTAGTSAIWPNGNDDCFWFAVDGDGGVLDTNPSQSDVAVFGFNQLLVADFNGEFPYAAGTTTAARGNAAAYYSLWGGVPAPASQLAAHSFQSGVTPVGTMGFAWHSVTITKQDTNLFWDIDGRRIGSKDITGVPLQNNVFVGYFDWFVSVATNTSVQFGLVDNVRVENLVAVPTAPTITSITVVGSNVQVDFTGAASDTTGSFVLQSSPAVQSGFGDVSATITQLAPGSFRATRALNGPVQFYRIRR